MGFPHMHYFRAIHNATGVKYAKDAKLAEYHAQFGADFDSSINVVHDALRNDVPQDFIIVPTDTGCDLWARPGETFNIGDIIYYNTLHWLVTDVNFNDDLNRSGKMVACNRQVSWQNQKTGEIITRWCLAKKPYTSNIAEGMAIANSNREFKIQIAYDAETIMVDLDRRFLLEVIGGQPKAYQVTSVDTMTNRYQDADGGFLVWNMKQCEYNPGTDNVELMIADYIDPNMISPGVTPEPVEAGGYCSISGRSTIPCGAYRRYTPCFFDAGGGLLENKSPVWTVDAGDITESVTVEADMGTLVVTVGEDARIGELISIVLEDSDGVCTPASMKVEVIDLL